MTPIPLMVSIFAPLLNWLAGILHFTRPACNDLVIGSRGLRSAVSSLDTAVNISKPGPEIGLAPTPNCDRKRTPEWRRNSISARSTGAEPGWCGVVNGPFVESAED